MSQISMSIFVATHCPIYNKRDLLVFDMCWCLEFFAMLWCLEEWWFLNFLLFWCTCCFNEDNGAILTTWQCGYVDLCDVGILMFDATQYWIGDMMDLLVFDICQSLDWLSQCGYFDVWYGYLIFCCWIQYALVVLFAIKKWYQMTTIPLMSI